MSAAAADSASSTDPSPQRRETFLARYPRRLKLGAVGGLLIALMLPWVLWGGAHRKHGLEVSIATAVSGADSRTAIANPPPAHAPPTHNDSGSADSSSAAPEASESDTIILATAPDSGLSEDTPIGSLPRIGEDGRQPWQVYARPFDLGDKRPRIAIVVTGLGLARVASDAAIDRLPPAVTLAVDTQSPVAGAWCARARQAGHETILMLPMEPFDYPRSDPGPGTLLTNLPNSDNIQRLQAALMQATGYIGVTTLSGSRFTTDPAKITPILDELHRRGLMVFDARVAPHSTITDLARDAHIPVAVDTLRLDQNLSPAAIDEALNQLEETARLNGRAVGMTPPLPVVIDRLGPWIKQLASAGITFAPLSAVAQ